MAEEISWDDAIASDGFVKLEADKEKVLVVTNIHFEKVKKFDKEQVELQSDVLEEDGKETSDKKFTTSSRRLKQKLRPILEGKAPADKVKLSILKVGDRFDTQYSVKEIAMN